MDFEKSNIDVTVFDERQNENNPRLSTASKTRSRQKIIGALPDICRALESIKIDKLDAISYNKIIKKEILEPIKEDKVLVSNKNFKSDLSSCRTGVQRSQSVSNLKRPAIFNKRSSLLGTNAIIKQNTIPNTEVDSINEKSDKNKLLKNTTKSSNSEQSSCRTGVQRSQSVSNLKRPAIFNKRSSLLGTNAIIKQNTIPNTEVDSINEKSDINKQLKNTTKSSNSEQSSSNLFSMINDFNERFLNLKKKFNC